MDENMKNDEAILTVPYVVYRDSVAHNHWVVKALVIALIISVFLIFASNAVWLYAWNQYDYSTEETVTTVDSDGEGIANFNYTGGDGGVIFGEGYSTQGEENAP